MPETQSALNSAGREFESAISEYSNTISSESYWDKFGNINDIYNQFNNPNIITADDIAIPQTSGISLDRSQTKKKTKSVDKSITISKTKSKKKNPVYFSAEATFPGATVKMYESLPLKGAILRARKGNDVYALTSYDAERLCNKVSKFFGNSGFEGPTNDGYPRNAMHYHPITGDPDIRPHIFFGYDPNLKKKFLP